ncbi:AMP-binding protein [Enhygromyxa salina]|uniref:Long-chain-fatty-acid--CoA ligase n=1 Tax=Enhygromyxa salina TaxID=215803 RepID=A0A2S9XL70_9BACT|nr:AMP-binding protein [Enhygromyxa salina]PRP93593.1 Long-chain-fatty-acid--CoA ligase [Enhygromyxa salina]
MSEQQTNAELALASGEATERGPLDVEATLAGKNLIVIGTTGFLGKVWLAMLLHRYPNVGTIYTVVRSRKTVTSDERWWSEIVPSPVFDPLREQHGNLDAWIKTKVVAIDGDVTRDLLGVDPALVSELAAASGTAKQIHAIVNVAGVVDFNPPLDEALNVNAYGARHLIALARALGDVPIMHTSTCFVVGCRDGVTEERNTLEFPFPRADELDVGHWSAEREIQECGDLVASTRRRAEDAPRQSHLLDEAKRNLRDRHEPLRGAALDDELDRVKRRFVRERLIAAGAERATFWGWPNIYTYTKSIGEQVLLASGLPLTIVRPSIVESATSFPKVGWCEGISTSTPIMYLTYQGQQNIPVGEHCYYDAIPVDMCSAGMIGALAALLAERHEVCYQLCTSDANPLKTRRAGELIGLAKRRYYNRRTKGNPIVNMLQAHTEPAIVPIEHYQRWSSPQLRKRSEQVASLLGRFTDTPSARYTEPLRKQAASLAKTATNIEAVFEAFIPFITANEYRFSAKNTRALMKSLSPADQAKLAWNPEDIDWREYWLEVHHKGVEEFSIPLLEDRLRKETKALRRHDNLVAMLLDLCERHEHALAFQRLEGDPPQLTRITYRDLERRSAAVAQRLWAAGVRKGDRVALSGRNHPSWGIVYFGILRCGAAAVPVDKDFEALSLATVLRKSKAKVAVFDEHVVSLANQDELCPRWDLYETAAATHPDNDPEPVAPDVEISDDDLASVLYTSGTTGDPKGVMLTHANFTALIAALAPLFPLAHDDRVLSVLPLHHTFEFTCGMLLPLSRGARVIYLDEINGDRMIDGLALGQVTAMIGVPALWELIERRILNEVRERGKLTEKLFDFTLDLNRNIGKTLGVDLGRVLFGPIHQQLGGNLKYLVSGAAALPKDVHRTFQGLGLHLAEGYGLTEAAPVLTLSKASARNKGGNVGKAIPGVDIKIDNPNDEGVGEVLARGPNVMVGYESDAEATQQALEDGWLRTGDLGKLDNKSQLKIVGRSKEVILSASGENVYPDDVEVMLGLPKFIKELSIVGIPDRDKDGAERVAVLAVPDYANRGLDQDNDQKVDRADRRREAEFELRKDIAALPRHMRPTVIHFTDVELPRTATRKVTRKRVQEILETLREASEAVAAAKASATNGDRVGFVRSAIASIAKKKPEDLLDSHDLQNDLGFDSLMVVELTSTLEAASPRLSSVDLSALRTVAQLEDAARAAEGRKIEPSKTRKIERDDEDLYVPEFIRDPAKAALTVGQLSFYDRFMQVEVSGKANIPYNRHTLVVANHASHLDMGLAKYALGSYGQELVALAAEDYFFKNKWMRAYFENFTNMAALDRRSGLRKAIEQAGEHIERGRTVLIFPEGSRSTDGVMREFMPLIGHLVLNYKVDVLPLWLGGTHKALPKGVKVPIPRQRKVDVRIGPPLNLEQLEQRVAGMKRSDAYREVARLSHNAVAALRDGWQLDLEREALDAAAGQADGSKTTSKSSVAARPGGTSPRPGVSGIKVLFEHLEGRFVPGAIDKPTSFYFSLGSASDGKWTLALSPTAASFSPGRPEGGSADCVLKTSVEIFEKIVRESYTPSVAEFMAGKVKSNDIALLQVFQKAFDL